MWERQTELFGGSCPFSADAKIANAVTEKELAEKLKQIFATAHASAVSKGDEDTENAIAALFEALPSLGFSDSYALRRENHYFVLLSVIDLHSEEGSLMKLSAAVTGCLMRRPTLRGRAIARRRCNNSKMT